MAVTIPKLPTGAKPKPPTLPQVKFDGNPDPARNRTGGVGAVQTPPLPDQVVQRQAQVGDNRAQPVTPGGVGTPSTAATPTATPTAAPTKEKKAYYDPRLGRVVVPGDPQWSQEGADQYASPSPTPPGANTATGSYPSTGAAAPTEDMGTRVQKLISEGKITPDDLTNAVNGNVAAREKIRAALGIPFSMTATPNELTTWLESVQSGPVAIAARAPSAVVALGTPLVPEGKAAATGKTTEQLAIEAVGRMPPTEIDKNAFTLGKDEYIKQVVARLKAGVAYPPPTDPDLKLWYDEAVKTAGVTQVGGAGASSAPYDTASYTASLKAFTDNPTAATQAQLLSYGPPPEPPGWDVVNGNLQYVGGTGAPPENNKDKEAWEAANRAWLAAKPSVDYFAQNALIIAGTKAKITSLIAARDAALAAGKNVEAGAFQTQLDDATGVSKRLDRLQAFAAILFPLFSNPQVYRNAKNNGLLDWLMGELKELGFTGIDFKPPTDWEAGVLQGGQASSSIRAGSN